MWLRGAFVKFDPGPTDEHNIAAPPMLTLYHTPDPWAMDSLFAPPFWASLFRYACSFFSIWESSDIVTTAGSFRQLIAAAAAGRRTFLKFIPDNL